jgi:transposase
MSKIIHFLGLDVHKESVAVSIAPSDSSEVRFYGEIGGALDDMDRLIKRLAAAAPEAELRFCYEAGPTGYPLCRHLRKKGFGCEVLAPSLIPKKPGERVKTNRRDSNQLARLFRAGEVTGIYVPDERDEAIRDLVRGRESARVDQLKARQRLKGFLLRHGFRYSGKKSWNEKHQRYLASLVMPFPAQQIVLREYIEAITVAGERLARLTKAVEDAHFPAREHSRSSLLSWRHGPRGHGLTLDGRWSSVRTKIQTTAQAQRPGPRDATIATRARWPGSLQRMVRVRHEVA